MATVAPDKLTSWKEALIICASADFAAYVRGILPPDSCRFRQVRGEPHWPDVFKEAREFYERPWLGRWWETLKQWWNRKGKIGSRDKIVVFEDQLFQEVKEWHDARWLAKWRERLKQWCNRKGKIGSRDRIVMFESQLFRFEPVSRFGVLKALDRSLSSYYLLMILATTNPAKDRRDAYAAGIRIVLDTEFTREQLDEEVFGSRRAERSALSERRRGLLKRLLVTAASLLLAALGVMASTLITTRISGCSPAFVDNTWWSRRPCKCTLASAGPVTLGTGGSHLQRLTLRIHNPSTCPIRGVSIQHDLDQYGGITVHGLPCQGQPLHVDRIEAGKSFAVEITLEGPRDVLEKLRNGAAGIRVIDPTGGSKFLPLP